MIETRSEYIDRAQMIYDDLLNIRQRLRKLSNGIADGVEPKEFIKLSACALDVGFRTLGTAIIKMTEASVKEE
jgi:hypothetical protein